MLNFSQLFISWWNVRRSNYVRCSGLSRCECGRASPCGAPGPRFVTSISLFFHNDICIEWVDIEPQSCMRCAPHCPHFFINILTFPLFAGELFHNKNCVDPFVRRVLIWFILSRQNSRHPVRRAARAAAAFVNLLARLLVFSLVGANKKLRMSLEPRIVSQSSIQSGFHLRTF